jgi:hypothetical protein
MQNKPYFLLALLLLAGCKTIVKGGVSSRAHTAAAPTPSTASATRCEDSCGGVVGSPQSLGCVIACDTWQADKTHVAVGESIYPKLAQDPQCKFQYEKREAAQVQEGAFYEAFNFSFTFSRGVGDGVYYNVGSGLVGANHLVDFTRERSELRLEAGGEEGEANVVFLRHDKQYGELPTFTVTGDDILTKEQRQLVIVLNANFDPRHPFKSVKNATFWSRSAAGSKFEILCAGS